ncbi:MAG TPA: metalloregulator ArsR/SmtB family transcription factor [bacterium]|jgi:DNA-binding transcriptional ArsR family regulator|nr:metalloregulator ArsR/SmtB family transcription factor [bacterium]
MNRLPAHSDVFQAVAHPARRRILELLEAGELPVSGLARGFRGSAPALSQQLGVLKKARLVRERREGRQRIYRLTPGPLLELTNWVEVHKGFWSGKLEALGQYLRRKHG